MFFFLKINLKIIFESGLLPFRLLMYSVRVVSGDRSTDQSVFLSFSLYKRFYQTATTVYP